MSHNNGAHPISLGNWHEDHLTVYDNVSDEPVAMVTRAQGREIPPWFIDLLRSSYGTLEALRSMVAWLETNRPEDFDRLPVWDQAVRAIRAAGGDK